MVSTEKKCVKMLNYFKKMTLFLENIFSSLIGKGKASKAIHSNNGLLQKVGEKQQKASINLQYQDKSLITMKLSINLS